MAQVSTLYNNSHPSNLQQQPLVPLHTKHIHTHAHTHSQCLPLNNFHIPNETTLDILNSVMYDSG